MPRADENTLASGNSNFAAGGAGDRARPSRAGALRDPPGKTNPRAPRFIREARESAGLFSLTIVAREVHAQGRGGFRGWEVLFGGELSSHVFGFVARCMCGTTFSFNVRNSNYCKMIMIIAKV